MMRSVTVGHQKRTRFRKGEAAIATVDIGNAPRRRAEMMTRNFKAVDIAVSGKKKDHGFRSDPLATSSEGTFRSPTGVEGASEIRRIRPTELSISAAIVFVDSDYTQALAARPKKG